MQNFNIVIDRRKIGTSFTFQGFRNERSTLFPCLLLFNWMAIASFYNWSNYKYCNTIDQTLNYQQNLKSIFRKLVGGFKTWQSIEFFSNILRFFQINSFHLNYLFINITWKTNRRGSQNMLLPIHQYYSSTDLKVENKLFSKYLFLYVKLAFNFHKKDNFLRAYVQVRNLKNQISSTNKKTCLHDAPT